MIATTMKPLTSCGALPRIQCSRAAPQISQGTRQPLSERTWKISPNISRSRHSIVRFADGEEGRRDVSPKTKKAEEQEKLTTSLKKAGLTPDQARRILKEWEAAGVKDPGSLRGFFLKGTVAPFAGLFFQTLLDGSAAGLGIASGMGLGGNPGWIPTLSMYLFYAIGFFFLLQATLDVVLLVSYISAATRFAVSSDSYLEVIRSIAGPETGITVVDKARLAQISTKMSETLEKIAGILGEQKIEEPVPDTLGNLSAFLIIDEAEQRFGLRFEEYGLSPQEGARLARWFAKYDANEDRRIEASELRKLVAEVDRPISQEEAERALALLDKNNNGVIEFNEFVEWMAGSKKKEPVKAGTRNE